MTCTTYKRCYPTEDIAEEALIQTRIRFENNSAIAVYNCEACGQWHLTSTGEVNSRLNELLSSGDIKKERDGMYWESKLK